MAVTRKVKDGREALVVVCNVCRAPQTRMLAAARAAGYSLQTCRRSKPLPSCFVHLDVERPAPITSRPARKVAAFVAWTAPLDGREKAVSYRDIARACKISMRDVDPALVQLKDAGIIAVRSNGYRAKRRTSWRLLVNQTSLKASVALLWKLSVASPFDEREIRSFTESRSFGEKPGFGAQPENPTHVKMVTEMVTPWNGRRPT